MCSFLHAAAKDAGIYCLVRELWVHHLRNNSDPRRVIFPRCWNLYVCFTVLMWVYVERLVNSLLLNWFQIQPKPFKCPREHTCPQVWRVSSHARQPLSLHCFALIGQKMANHWTCPWYWKHYVLHSVHATTWSKSPLNTNSEKTKQSLNSLK